MSTLISESMLKSLEARRRRRGERKSDGLSPAPGKAATAARAPADFAGCARALEEAIRGSIRTSFESWSAGLMPQLQGLARKAAESASAAPPSFASTVAPRSAPPPIAPASPAAARPSEDPPLVALQVPVPPPAKARDAGIPDGAKPPGKDSWNDLVEAVCDLRRQWDRETFEMCLEDRSPKAKTVVIKKPAAAPVAADLVERAASAPAAGDLPSAPVPPQQTERSPQPVPHAAPPAPAPADRSAPAGSPPEEVSGKLDHLIQLVQESLESQSDKDAPFPSPSEVSSQIAREVAGRLQATLSSWSPPAGAAASPRPVAPPPKAEEPARIPIDDIAAMVDLINGSR
jgi:hypothetical protein